MTELFFAISRLIVCGGRVFLRWASLFMCMTLFLSAAFAVVGKRT